MSCRVACQPEPRRHWPIFSPPDLPDGLAECLVCRDWITAVDFVDGVCAGPTTEGNPMRRHEGMSPVQADGSCFESREPGHLDPVTISRGRSESATGQLLADPRDIERARTLTEIRRCAEHQW